MILQKFKEKKANTENKPKETVLFVCTGNTCRSPMAEALFNYKYAENAGGMQAGSCGLYGDGSPMSTNAEKALDAVGIKGFSHASRRADEEHLRQATKIIGISKSHAEALIMQYPQFASKVYAMPIDIPDPYGGDLEVYKQCLEMIDRALAIAFSEEGEINEDN